MALIVKFPNGRPYGTLDGLDAQVSSFKGGEVVTLTSVALAADISAADSASDGYLLPSSVLKRTVVTKTLASGKRPLFLADEGTTYYGTVFGKVVGGTAGKDVAGSQVGPGTANRSGKITCWDAPGIYAVTLDAVDTNASTGLTLTNTSLDAGSPLYATTAGILTPNAASSFEASLVVARFMGFETSGSHVNTQPKFASALNSNKGIREAVIHWAVET